MLKPPHIHLKLKSRMHSRSTARPRATLFTAAHNHNPTITRGSLADRPSVNSRARIGSSNADRSIWPTASQMIRT